MLIQLYNSSTESGSLIYEIYKGYYNSVISWFNTAELIAEGSTADLTNLTTATDGQFSDSDTNKSMKIYGYFKPPLSGNYRFFLVTSGKSYLNINDVRLIFNNGGTSVYNTISMTAGQFYKIDIYNGVNIGENETLFSCGYDFVRAYPPLPFINNNPITVSNFQYGDGTYSINSSSENTNDSYRRYRAFDKTVTTSNSSSAWISLSSRYGNNGQYIGSATTPSSLNGNIPGEWLELTCPSNKPFILNSFLIRSRNTAFNVSGMPKWIYVFGFNGTNWDSLYETQDIDSEVNDYDDVWTVNEAVVLNPIVTTAYSRYRLVIRAVKEGTGSGVIVSEWELYEADSLPSVSNATGLGTFFGSPSLSLTDEPLIYSDVSLHGTYKVSLLTLSINRYLGSVPNKGDIFYLASDDLFNNYNGTYKNYIQLHEKPVAYDVERKRFTQFSDDMSLVCDFNGKIVVQFRRGDLEPLNYNFAHLVLYVERIPTNRM